MHSFGHYLLNSCTTMMVRCMEEIEGKITPNFLLNPSVTKYSSISRQATCRDYSQYCNKSLCQVAYQSRQLIWLYDRKYAFVLKFGLLQSMLKFLPAEGDYLGYQSFFQFRFSGSIKFHLLCYDFCNIRFQTSNGSILQQF